VVPFAALKEPTINGPEKEDMRAGVSGEAAGLWRGRDSTLFAGAAVPDHRWSRSCDAGTCRPKLAKRQRLPEAGTVMTRDVIEEQRGKLDKGSGDCARVGQAAALPCWKRATPARRFPASSQ